MYQQFNIAQYSTILTFCGNGTETTIGKVFDSAPVVVDIVFSLLSDECSAPFPMTIPWTGSEFWVRVRVNFLLWSPILRFNINMFVIFQRKVVTCDTPAIHNVPNGFTKSKTPVYFISVKVQFQTHLRDINAYRKGFRLDDKNNEIYESGWTRATKFEIQSRECGSQIWMLVCFLNT